MKQLLLSKQDNGHSELMTALILEHSENMLILAYSLTNNATRANKIVENIFLHLLVQINLTEHLDLSHAQLYAWVKKACGERNRLTK